MVTRAEILREALTWKDTPFLWQASVKGRGVDCKGLFVGIARELGMPEADVLEVAVANYRPNFKGEQMLAGLEKALIRTTSPLPADLMAILIDPRDTAPRHLAMIIDGGRLLHCYGKGPKRVITAPIGKSRPIHSYWTWPSLQGG